MKNFHLLILLTTLLFFLSKVSAQSGLPSGACGIQYTYDAAGNMIDRQYVCNNVGAVVKENKVILPNTHKDRDVIYPDSTSGRFTLRIVNSSKNVERQGSVTVQQQAINHHLIYTGKR